MLVVLNFTATESEPRFLAAAADALTALAACPGYQRGRLARAYEEPDRWCLVLEWESVGAYRRGLSNARVKMQATGLLAQAWPQVSAFEPVLAAGPGETIVAPGAAVVAPVASIDPDGPVASRS